MAARPRNRALLEHGPAIAAVRARRGKRMEPAPAPPPADGISLGFVQPLRPTPDPARPHVSPFDEIVRNTCATCVRPFTYRVGDGYTDRCPKCLRQAVEDLEVDVANLTAEEESLHDAQRDLEAKEEEVEQMKKEIEALQGKVSAMEDELHDALDLVEKMKERRNG